MNDRWNSTDAPADDRPLEQRVYTSRLLGADPRLVLHGGGNTSVKIREPDFFGTPTDVLYVKGSGWDLATIEAAGFAPIRMEVLLRLADLDTLTDTDMVRQQRVASLDPSAPNPSVEAILHAIIPHRFVDHTHADAIVTMTNTPGGEAWVREALGPTVMIVPYVMPGFDLCKRVADMTRGLDWSTIEAMVLMNHGIFTFGNTAKESYQSMIRWVAIAEDAVARRTAVASKTTRSAPAVDDAQIALLTAQVRKAASRHAGRPMIVHLDRSDPATRLASLDAVADVAARGPATPDHVIRTKPHALVLPSTCSDDVDAAVDRYAHAYEAYVRAHARPETIALDPAPRWVVVPQVGHLAIGTSPTQASIVADIARHTADIAVDAESCGGWRPLDDADLFAVEYWDLEQAKVRSASKRRDLEGRVALVTGAASGIGHAIATRLVAEGAAVIAVDVNPSVTTVHEGVDVLPVVCDVTDHGAMRAVVWQGIARFGGLDVVVANAGFLPASRGVDDFDLPSWQASMDVNVTSAAALASICTPYLRLGCDPSFVVVGSKNVPAPGNGAATYSVAKAGLTQWARVAALELARNGIRVNVVHPDAVFDTGLWTDAVLDERAAHYGMTVDAYKKRNLLGLEVRSVDVANVVYRLVTTEFRAVTGAQVPVDGGNERVV